MNNPPAPAVVPAQEHGVRLPLGTRVQPKKHPSRGGNAYSQDTRQQVLAMFQNGGFAALQTDAIEQLPIQKKFPSMSTCKLWINEIYQPYGHVLEKRATGNHFSERELHGQDLINLAIFRMIHPKGTLDEARTYVHNRNDTVPPYSTSQIHRAQKRLRLSRKVGSSTAELAYTPMNLLKRNNYWHQQYPYGVLGVDINCIIDIDEAQFKLESQDRKRGVVAKDRRCNATGLYKKGANAISLLMAISSDEEEPFQFHQQFQRGGTNLARFYNFIDELLNQLAEQFPNQQFLFTMDNLNIHKHQSVKDLIHNAGHGIVYRAPYWSCDGAIEYVFNTLQSCLQTDPVGVREVDELEEKISHIITNELTPGGFTPYFLHVGFRR